MMELEVHSAHLVDVVSHGQDIHLEHHMPVIDATPYHTHPSIEINYLRDCDMTYSFSGQLITIPRDRLCVFWSVYPHRPVALNGLGEITNAYISLQKFLEFPLSPALVDQLMAGAILCVKAPTDADRTLFDRWATEVNSTSDNWKRLHRLELQARLARLDVEGWDVINEPRSMSPRARVGGPAVAHFDTMLRFISARAFDPISVQDIANSAGISRNYAIILFRKMLGVTVKSYLMDLRVQHAKMMLTESNEKILNVALDCGFVSLSSFYEAFGNATGQSPAVFRTSRSRDSAPATSSAPAHIPSSEDA